MPWKQTKIVLLLLRLHPSTVFPDLITELTQSWGSRDSWRHKQNLVCTTTWRKEQWPQKRLRQTCLCEWLGVSGRGMGWQWPASGSGSLTTAVLGGVGCWYKSFWRRSTLLPLPLPLFSLRWNYREGLQPHPSAENWIKDFLNMDLPTRTRPSFPHSQSLPSGRKTNQTDHRDPNLV